MMGSKRSAKRNKGKPDGIDAPIHKAIKNEEEAESGEDTAIDAVITEAESSEAPVPEAEEIPESEASPKVKKDILILFIQKLIDKLLPIKTPFEIIRRCLMLVLLIVFVVSGTKLIKNLIDYKRGSDIYGEIADSIFSGNLGGESLLKRLPKPTPSPKLPDYYTALEGGDSVGDTAVDPEYNMKFEQMKANLNFLKKINPDIYGYIHIEGTRISFPIVQGEDNEYYLNHAYNNEYVVVGSIYVDYRADRNIENNRNTVLYGHNMQDGNMFNNVTLFYDEELFNNTLIEIYTFDGIYIYEPFSIFETTKFHNYSQMDFETDEDFVAFCELMQECSARNKDEKMTFTPDDRIITLSTCTTSPETYFTGRNALHAKLIRVER